MFRHLVLVIFLCIIKIKSEQVIMQRIPVRQYAKYDLNENLEWFPAIVGGVPASIGEFPSQVSIQTNKNRHLCGGVLIDYDYILTAGHCVVDELGNTLESRKIIVMGDDLSITKNASSTRQNRKVIHIFLHPNYNHYEASNDIAILKTEKFTQTPSLRPTSIAFDSPKEGEVCKLAGWGTQNENTKKPNPRLYKATLTISNFEQCNMSYAGQLKSNMFCAKGQQQDSCQGDSGSALLCDEMISGIVSFGNGCDNPKFPGVYTDVKSHEVWIDEVLRTAIEIKEDHENNIIDDKGSSIRMLLSTTLLASMLLITNIFV